MKPWDSNQKSPAKTPSSKATTPARAVSPTREQIAAELHKAHTDVKKAAQKPAEKDIATKAQVEKESTTDTQELKSKEREAWKQKLEWERAYLEAIKDTPLVRQRYGRHPRHVANILADHAIALSISKSIGNQ